MRLVNLGGYAAIYILGFWVKSKSSVEILATDVTIVDLFTYDSLSALLCYSGLLERRNYIYHLKVDVCP